MKILRRTIGKYIYIGIIACIVAASSATVLAANSTYSISGKAYENKGENNFAKGSNKDKLAYGKNALGSMSIVGEIEEKGLYENVTAFGINDDVIEIL